MNKTLLLASVATLSLAGCGIGLTPGAIHCGTAPGTGIDVWVDGVTVQSGPWAGQPVAAMSCATALNTVVQARALGEGLGFWDASQGFGYRVEFVNQLNLAAEGFSESSGETDTFIDHDTVVSYGYDGTQWSNTFQPSEVTMAHEMLHMAYGETDHCNWSTRYAPAFGSLGPVGIYSGFDDKCAHVSCRGDECKPDAP